MYISPPLQKQDPQHTNLLSPFSNLPITLQPTVNQLLITPLCWCSSDKGHHSPPVSKFSLHSM